jgi:squalene-associated FAD-dependent desaturase
MTPDAVVIGAGFAGLSAATALADQGARVLVLEARPGLGGRATSFRDPETDEKVDNGPHILVGAYQETRRFLARIGAGDRVRWQASLSVRMIDRRGDDTTLALPALPSPLHLVGGVLAWDALGWRERFSLVGLGRRLGGDGRPDETVRTWLERHGQAPRLVELFWEPLALAATNQSIDEVAAPHFLAVIGRMLGADPGAAALGLPAVPLDDLYAEPAREWLGARGGEVQTNTRATVTLERDRVCGVRAHGESIAAPIVVSAVPWHALAGLFEAPPTALADILDHAAALGSSPIVTVHLWFDRAVMDEPLVGLPGRRFQWVFNRRAIVGDGGTHVSLISSGAKALVSHANEELVAAALSELGEALPAARAAGLVRAVAVRERQSTFSLAPGAPPRPQTVTPVKGLLLAGDWTDTGLPATIESAVVSGHRAAAEVSATKGTKDTKTH